MTTATNNTIRVEIFDGGNKFELFQQLMNTGLKDDNGKTVNRPHFRIKALLEGLGGNLFTDDHLWITGISAEDGSGESWIIEGGCRGGSFEGLYNTRSRLGFIDIRFGH